MRCSCCTEPRGVLLPSQPPRVLLVWEGQQPGAREGRRRRLGRSSPEDGRYGWVGAGSRLAGFGVGVRVGVGRRWALRGRLR